MSVYCETPTTVHIGNIFEVQPLVANVLGRYVPVKSNLELPPPTPPRGAFAYPVSPGGGALANFVWPRGRWAFAYPGQPSF